MTNHKKVFWLTFILAMQGCASQQDSKVRERFITEIRADDSKMFVFTLNLAKSAEAGKPQQRKTTRENKGKVRGNKPDKGTKATGRSKDKRLSGIFMQRLELALDQNDYCRNGYIELARYATKGSMSLRGECNESATGKDRKNFPNKANIRQE